MYSSQYSNNKSRVGSTTNKQKSSSSSKYKLFGGRDSKTQGDSKSALRKNAFAGLEEEDEYGAANGKDRSMNMDAMKTNIESIDRSIKKADENARPNRSIVYREEEKHNQVVGKDWQEVKAKEKPEPRPPALASVFRPRQRNALELQDWRSGNGVPQRDAPGTTNSFRRSRFVGARIHYEISVEQVVKGVIIWHMDTRECYNDNPKSSDDIFKSGDGQSHIRKGRFWYVDSVHEYHINELPIYTYQHKGIAQKSEAVKREHVGIRPLHMSAKDYVQQNNYPPLEMERMNNKKEKLDEMSFLHFTEQRSVSFNTPMRIVGKVVGASNARVAKLRGDHGCL